MKTPPPITCRPITPCSNRIQPGLRFAVSLMGLSVLIMTGCGSQRFVHRRARPENLVVQRLANHKADQRSGDQRRIVARGLEPSRSTWQTLRAFDLDHMLPDRLQEATRTLTEMQAVAPTLDTVHALAELNFLAARRLEREAPQDAVGWYLKSLLHSYAYLLDPMFAAQRTGYDPHFRTACDLYNTALEQCLRYAQNRGRFHPDRGLSLTIDGQPVELAVSSDGFRWKAEDFQRFEFVSDYKVTGLTNRHRRYGLGVPLIAVRGGGRTDTQLEQFYINGLSFPVTAVLRCKLNAERPGDLPTAVRLELYDPLETDHWNPDSHPVPLQSDITTPLAYFLDNTELDQLETFGLLRPDRVKPVSGLYMLQPYAPGKIPVLMIHGFWSSPATWMDVVNDLRSRPEIRDRFQFWFYLYPTGEPFWETAADVRRDLHAALDVLSPGHSDPALDEMVVVGHSMGGLVARLLTLSSGDTLWSAVSDTPIALINASDETRTQLERTYYFEPATSIRRVVMIGSPHRGSNLANSMTRWLARNLIYLPKKTLETTQQLLSRNPRMSRNARLTVPKTSVDGLAPDSPILQAMQRLTADGRVRFHSVIGSQTRGRLQDTNDGVVTYASAHRDDIDSELIVRSDHSRLHRHPKTIRELQRILLQHLQQSQADSPAGIVHVGNLGHSSAPSERPSRPEAAGAGNH